MIPDIMPLWLPILLSTVGVFIVSSLIWTVIQWHNADWKKLPEEDRVRQALKGVAHGQYTLPYAANNKAKQDPEWQARARQGPMAMITVWQGDATNMGKPLIQWFIYILVVTVFIAAVSAVTLDWGDSFMIVFHSVAIYGFMIYSGAHAMGGIWFGHGWGRVVKDMIDGLIYAVVTGALFGWLWPA